MSMLLMASTTALYPVSTDINILLLTEATQLMAAWSTSSMTMLCSSAIGHTIHVPDHPMADNDAEESSLYEDLDYNSAFLQSLRHAENDSECTYYRSLMPLTSASKASGRQPELGQRCPTPTNGHLETVLIISRCNNIIVDNTLEAKPTSGVIVLIIDNPYVKAPSSLTTTTIPEQLAEPSCTMLTTTSGIVQRYYEYSLLQQLYIIKRSL